MNTDIAKRYRALSAEELVNIAFVDEADYETEAIELAKRELLSRGITSQTAYEEILARAREETAQTQEETAEALATRNAAPLETSDKVLFFIPRNVSNPTHTSNSFNLHRIAKKQTGTEKTSQPFMWLFFGLCVAVGAMMLYLLFFRWAPSIVSP